jgi:hypothetical protein
MKIVWWIIFGFCLYSSFQYSFLFIVDLFLLVTGPCVAIPAILAWRGQRVESGKSVRELKTIVSSKFAENKIKNNWSSVQGDDDQNFSLWNTKSDCRPIVSVHYEDLGNHLTAVHICMTYCVSGGLNGGKGTPFWVYGGIRALSKINDIATAVQD